MILANSLFTARVFKSYFPSIRRLPRVVYPGINLAAYEEWIDPDAPQVVLSYARVNNLFFAIHEEYIAPVRRYFLSTALRGRRTLFLLFKPF